MFGAFGAVFAQGLGSRAGSRRALQGLQHAFFSFRLRLTRG